MPVALLPLVCLILFAPQRSPSDAGLRSEDRAIAVLITLHDPASVASQIDITPGGLTTLSYFFIRNRDFVIQDSSQRWIEATVSLAPSGHRYLTRDGIGIGTTDVTYVVRVRFGRRVYTVVSGKIIPTDAYVWEAEQFGVSPADESGRARIHQNLTACLEHFADAFDRANPEDNP